MWDGCGKWVRLQDPMTSSATFPLNISQRKMQTVKGVGHPFSLLPASATPVLRSRRDSSVYSMERGSTHTHDDDVWYSQLQQEPRFSGRNIWESENKLKKFEHEHIYGGFAQEPCLPKNSRDCDRWERFDVVRVYLHSLRRTEASLCMKKIDYLIPKKKKKPVVMMVYGNYVNYPSKTYRIFNNII